MGYTLSKTSTTITFHVTHISGYDYYRLWLRRADDPDNMIVNGVGVTATGNFDYPVTGLEPGTAYTTNVYYRVGADTTDDHDPLGPITVTTDTVTEGRPAEWVWGNITAGQLIPLSGSGYLAPVTAAEWNGFCERVNQFRAYAGLEEYAFAAVTAEEEFDDGIVAAVLSAVGEIPGAGVLPEANVLGASFYHGLATALNAVP